MSSTKRSLDGEGEDDSNKKHKSDESTTSATTDLPPSIDRISVLPDVLHSHILTFLPLKDLESSLRVSNRWLYIVDKKMPPIQGISSAAQLRKLARLVCGQIYSSLSRHVVSYRNSTNCIEQTNTFSLGTLALLELEPRQLHRLSLAIPRLTELAVRLERFRSNYLIFPLFPKTVTYLEVHVPISNVESNQLILEACTQLHSLVDFRLSLHVGYDAPAEPAELISTVNFHPLRIRSESDGRLELEFYLYFSDPEGLTPQQINDLRAIKQNRLPCSISRNPTLARRLLQEPHNGWTSLSKLEENGELEEKNVDLLLKLTNLNQLAFKFGGGPFYDDSTFLPDLINLTDVTIWMNDKYSSIIIDILMGSLQHLHKLTRLSITGSQHLSSDHLTHLLLQLPSLETLQLHNCPKVQSSSNLKCRSLLVS